MNAVQYFFAGMQAISFCVFGLLIFKYWRACREREELFRVLRDARGAHPRRMRLLLICAYAITTIIIFVLSSPMLFL